VYNKKTNVRSFFAAFPMARLSRSAKGEHTRQAILEAAYELFLKQGFTATSMRQIAQRAGLTVGGIYNYFAGKEAIFREIFRDRHPYHQILPVLLTTPTADPERFVRIAAQTIVAELENHPDLLKLMLIEIVEFNGRHAADLISHILPQLLSPLTDLGAQGRLRDIPPPVFLRAFLGLFFSYYLTEWLIAGTPLVQTQQNALDHFIEIFLYGVLSDKEKA
jgi:AcrR family transcriptional regulator